MKVRKVVAESVLTAGLGVAGIFSGGTASAAPGISFDPGTNGNGTIGIGDTQSATGATAKATPDNRALAISLIGPSRAEVFSGSNNTAFAFDGQSLVNGGSDNNVFTSYGATTVLGGDDKGNTFINAGGVTFTDGDAENQTSLQFCGTRLSAQSSHITTTKMPAGQGIC